MLLRKKINLDRAISHSLVYRRGEVLEVDQFIKEELAEEKDKVKDRIMNVLWGIRRRNFPPVQEGFLEEVANVRYPRNRRILDW